MDYIIQKLITIPLILVCLTVHEFAHGFVAYKLGDTTAKEAGRLTLNPFKHIDWIGALAMFLLGFGWAKPVPVNPYRFTKSGSRGIIWVSLAGPVSNLILAFVTLLVYGIIICAFPTAVINSYVYILMASFASLNIGLAVFNLIPVPPLDGSKVLMYFMPYNAKCWMEQNQNMMFMILMFASFAGVLGRVITPFFNLITSGMLWIINFILRLIF